MWERDARRMQETLARHDEIMRGVVTGHGGSVFKMVGDACYAAFASAPGALRAALAAQRAIFSEPWDERSRVRVRMALHTGEVEERDGDYFGPPLNRVARLLSAGHGGQTLVSQATRERAEGHLPEGVSLRDMGERRLKDLKEPERIFQLLAPGLPSEFPPLKTLETASNEDRYRLIRQIGSGGMAEVYLAYDEFLQREVAFKVLDRKYAEDKEAIERFRREARSAASLHHPNIVATHDRGETEGGTYYIVMEYLEGGTLEDLIDREGQLPPREAAEIALEVADALSVAHESGVIHRDIKPQNILLSGSGEAKVADFGIARALSATTMTRAGSILGTVHYISPEQALGEQATYQSDLYSLGVVLYEMLTGELPYDAETPVGVVMKHVSGVARSPSDVNPDVPEELDAVAGRLLSREPGERYQDAAALAEDLEQIIEALPQADRTRASMLGTKEAGAGRGNRPGTSGRRRRTGAGTTRARRAERLRRVGVLAAMVLVSVGVVAAVIVIRGNNTGSPAATANTARTLPSSEGQPLKPSRYRSDEYRPPVSFTVDDSWNSFGTELPDALALGLESAQMLQRPPMLGFFTPQAVVDRSDPTGNTVTPAPESVDGWVAWFRNHPNLETGKPVPVTVGGASGKRVDAVVSSVPKRHPAWLWTLSDGTAISDVTKGARSRTFILDVDGKTVLIAIRGDDYEKLLPRAMKVVNTVKWSSK
jgi:tRNA A-37 threonylcarbamoyl transferase component Bud32